VTDAQTTSVRCQKLFDRKFEMFPKTVARERVSAMRSTLKGRANLPCTDQCCWLIGTLVLGGPVYIADDLGKKRPPERAALSYPPKENGLLLLY
jgi:hypothetical protein